MFGIHFSRIPSGIDLRRFICVTLVLLMCSACAFTKYLFYSSTNPLPFIHKNVHKFQPIPCTFECLELCQWVNESVITKFEIGMSGVGKRSRRRSKCNECLVLVIQIHCKTIKMQHQVALVTIASWKAYAETPYASFGVRTHRISWPSTAWYGLRRWWWNLTNSFQFMFAQTEDEKDVACYFIFGSIAEPLPSA